MTGWSIERLDELLPPLDEQVTPLRQVEEPVEAVEVPATLAERVAEGPGADRSEQHWVLVREAVKAGLSDAEVFALVASHAPSVDKYGGRLEAETSRTLAKARTTSHNGYSKEGDAVGEEKPRLVLRRVRDALVTPTPEPVVLVDGMMRAGELVVVGAPRALGKSHAGFNLATLLGRGEGLMFGALPVRRAAKVLYAQGEIDHWEAEQRWRRLGTNAGAVFETFDRWRIRTVRRRSTSTSRDDNGSATEAEDWTDAVLDGRLEETVVAEGIEVLIIDPWAVYFAGNENSNDETEAALDKLRDLSLRYGLAVVILHHVGKTTECREVEDLWRGASRLADWASTRITMLPHYTERQAKAQGMTRQQARRYVDVFFLRRSAPTDDFSVVYNAETGWWERWMAPEEAASERRVHFNPVDVAELCRAGGGVWPSVAAAAGALGVADATARKLLSEAVRSGHLEPFAGPRGAQGHRVSEEEF